MYNSRLQVIDTIQSEIHDFFGNKIEAATECENNAKTIDEKIYYSYYKLAMADILNNCYEGMIFTMNRWIEIEKKALDALKKQ